MNEKNKDKLYKKEKEKIYSGFRKLNLSIQKAFSELGLVLIFLIGWVLLGTIILL